MLISRSGVDCHIVEFQYTGRKPLEQSVHEGLNVYTIHAPAILHKFRALSAELFVFHRFVRASLKKALQMHHLTPDVVHCYNTFAWKGVHHFANTLLPGKRPKLVIDFAEDLPSIMQEYDYVKRGLGRWLVNLEAWEKLQQHAVQNADKCIVVTEEAADDYCRRYAVERRKFLCINNLPNDALIQRSTATQQSDNHPFTLLYFGDTSFRRGTDQLVRTAPGIRSIMPDYEVIIVGHNKREQAALENLVKAHNCESYVHLLGFQPELDLPKYMSRSNIGVSPLKRNRHHDTTHANKLFQFMLGGLPLLVSDCTAQANLVTTHDLGAVFEANDDDDFIETVVRIQRTPDQCDLWRNNVHSYMRTHTLSDEIQPYVECIRQAQ